MVVFIATEVRIVITSFSPNFLEHFPTSSSEHTFFKVKGPSEEQVQMRKEESQTFFARRGVVQGS